MALRLIARFSALRTRRSSSGFLSSGLPLLSVMYWLGAGLKLGCRIMTRRPSYGYTEMFEAFCSLARSDTETLSITSTSPAKRAAVREAALLM
ncbi:hypothetical protein G6F24_018771 [Rhizopus arrhizus]|nr:hypothetical protein G6F24_018771 [Rhizopus arrhizus]